MAPVAVAAALVAATPSVAATGASDTASPVYRTDTSSSASNTFACDGFGCDFVINTKTTNYPCTAEVVVLASGQPALLYTNTFCQVSISGRFSFEGPEAGPCVIDAIQALKVRFTSGTNSAFNGSFDATGIFKPTGFSSDRTRITQAQVTVKGTDTLDLNPTGTGTIKNTIFTVRLPGSGISRTMCFPHTGSNPGYVSATLNNGTITIAP